jgi:O6-methylguanine-DNA--protein-cysteine methyltransferase
MFQINKNKKLGSDGSLAGYAGGLGRKRLLLEHESVFIRK